MTLPPVPVTIIVYVPTGVEAVVAIVMVEEHGVVEVGVQELGANVMALPVNAGTDTAVNDTA